MKLTTRRSGFTLLEIIIVIIIIGVLASLALPRFFKTVEFSRASEALTTLGTLRQAVDRCLMQGGNACTNLANLDVSNPNDNDAALFTYAVSSAVADGNIVLTATRNNKSNPGDAESDVITMTVESDGNIKICVTGGTTYNSLQKNCAAPAAGG